MNIHIKTFNNFWKLLKNSIFENLFWYLQIAKDNKRPMLLGRLVVDGPTISRGSVKALLSVSLRRTTLLLWFIWYVYYYYNLFLVYHVFMNANEWNYMKFSVSRKSTHEQLYKSALKVLIRKYLSFYLLKVWIQNKVSWEQNQKNRLNRASMGVTYCT